MKGDLSLMYRALAPLGLFAPVIREMELWEVGTLLGADRESPPPRVVVERPPADPDAPPPAGPRLAEVD